MKKINLFLILLLITGLFSGCGNESEPHQKPSPSPSLTSHPSPTPLIPEELNDKGIFSDYYPAAYRLLKKMSREEKIGQMLLTRCPQEDAETMIRNYNLGGLVLFQVDFKGLTPEQVTEKIQSFQNAAALPMIISVDEEGGIVNRVSNNPTLRTVPFQSPQTLFHSGGMNAVREDAKAKAEYLKKFGINLNLAPVADVSTNQKDFIFSRSFGKSAKETAEFVENVVKVSKENGMASTLKHFPGYGNNVDTHTGIAIDQRPFEQFEENDFLPFLSGIQAGAEFILVSHNIVTSMDAEKPASLSPEVHKILRDNLNFTGMIMTDDLSMDAINEYTTEPGSAAVDAVLAGNDIILLTDCKSGYEAILQAVHDDKIDEILIDKAVLHILAWKYSVGLLQE